MSDPSIPLSNSAGARSFALRLAGVVHRGSLLRQATLIAACALLFGCAASATQSGKGAGVTVDRLYPMRPGSVWTYDVDTGEGLPVLAITRVLGATGNRIEVSSGGDSLYYEKRADGLFRIDTNAYLLRTPIAQGNEWDEGDGARAAISSVDARASTPAGDFVGCVEVVESGGPSEKRIRTVFCPDVGPVEIESTVHIQLTGKSTRVIARLRGYDFSGALVPTP